MIVDQVKIRIRTHDPSTVDEQEFDNIYDALNYLSLKGRDYMRRKI
jgi:hypothetical protein